MLPDNYPVFHIDLEDNLEFESSDNRIPAYHSSKTENRTKLNQNETTTVFSTLGERRDNLDRVTHLLLSVLSSEGNPCSLWLFLMVIVTQNLSTISKLTCSTVS